MGDGRVSADLMLVGEQPGDREDREGQPFVGPAGKLLDRALADAGVDPARVFTTNAVKHFRWSGTRGKQRIHKTPSQVHVTACGPWLLAELALVRPAGVVLLGATAAQAVFGKEFRVTRSRGELLDWPTAGDGPGRSDGPAWGLATVHPSSVLRSRNRDEDFGLLVRDLAVAGGALSSRR
jgi:DNA polymerase